MILRGVLDQSLGQICIRGFAFLGDLERVSRADFTYQRNLITSQKKQILQFLNVENRNLFFPEIILSYVVPYDFSQLKVAKSIYSPLAEIQLGKTFRSNVQDITFTTKSIPFKAVADSRLVSNVQIVTVNVDDRLVTMRPFQRVDGNHRLSAATAQDDSDGFAQERLQRLVTPYCLILLADDEESRRFEKVVFHNINSKSIPLTDEEIYRVVMDDQELFTDRDLKEKPDFGPAYYFTRELKKRIDPAQFPTISSLLHDPKTHVESIRTVLMDFFAILKQQKQLTKDFAQFDRVITALGEVNHLYGKHLLLAKSQANGLLVAFLYFAYQRNVFNLDWFTSWVLNNHIYELKKVSPTDLVAIFDKILLSKKRTIFVSMPFGVDYCDNHYQFLQGVVNEINTEKDANIKLEPLRIDHYQIGSSFKIPDEILNKIADSGLLLADLTDTRANVYHEVGYLMGLARERKPTKLNLLMICNTAHTKLPADIGFNIRGHKILGFADTNQLKDPLKAELLSFYFKE